MLPDVPGWTGVGPGGVEDCRALRWVAGILRERWQERLGPPWRTAARPEGVKQLAGTHWSGGKSNSPGAQFLVI
ncbi:hypothetical protein NDU88_007482 [Pleurodeles waltl]|uniref:Uncharacterized protein n=1 Tax=Pleurodeles waltl TaxID=8319 RepID=A0AAV7N2C3_PLEWA|nr:hypothetical protein NDU88_007482 [Pleurodeles waltl]